MCLGITDEDAMKNGFMQDDEEGDNQIAKQQQDGDGDNTVSSKDTNSVVSVAQCKDCNSAYGGAYEQEVDEELKANLQARSRSAVH